MALVNMAMIDGMESPIKRDGIFIFPRALALSSELLNFKTIPPYYEALFYQ